VDPAADDEVAKNDDHVAYKHQAKMDQPWSQSYEFLICLEPILRIPSLQLRQRCSRKDSFLKEEKILLFQNALGYSRCFKLFLDAVVVAYDMTIRFQT
jgi:hypothetical protein